MTKMTRPRSAAGIVSFDGQIYALGGHDGLSIFDSVSGNHTHITVYTLLQMKGNALSC